MVFAKRVYDQWNERDGYRVLVDRLWPRGIKKNVLIYDRWLNDVAPSAALRKALHAKTLDFSTFSRQYHQEIAGGTALKELIALASASNLTLLTAAHLEVDNHITVLLTLLNTG
ncbi:DUF488 domain-containing protein [Rahnella sp. NRRL B-41462]|uniref:DUF488 domain-containing protein n=1 Tax=Rahnella sp. NRRL B-41462 TaxID=1610579 RepID=UPI000DD2F1AA|nr:DUF488 family protein [Rahnella sp. NRRL B-41462]